MAYSAIVVIYNPNSTGSSEQMAKDFKDELLQRLPHQDVELVATERAGHGEEIAYQKAFSRPESLIISSSGDGGYHDVINGIVRAQKEGARVTAGLLPAGNANDHYRNLHEDSIIDRIESNTTSMIDLLKLTGTVNQQPIERYAHSYIGFGLTPAVAIELNKTQLNRLNEVWIVIKSLLSTDAVPLEVNGRVRHYESIICANVDKMSKVLKVADSSDPQDGKFEVTAFRRRSRLRLIGLLFKASLTGVSEDMQVNHLQLRTVRKTAVQADGEVLMLDPRTDVSIAIDRQVLCCLV